MSNPWTLNKILIDDLTYRHPRMDRLRKFVDQTRFSQPDATFPYNVYIRVDFAIPLFYLEIELARYAKPLLSHVRRKS